MAKQKFTVLRGNHVDPDTGVMYKEGSVIESDRPLDEMDSSKYKKGTAAAAKMQKAAEKKKQAAAGSGKKSAARRKK